MGGGPADSTFHLRFNRLARRWQLSPIEAIALLTRDYHQDVPDNPQNDQDDHNRRTVAVLATEAAAQSTTTFYNSGGQSVGRATTTTALPPRADLPGRALQDGPASRGGDACFFAQRVAPLRCNTDEQGVDRYVGLDL
jgi:hypothetical protein